MENITVSNESSMLHLIELITKGGWLMIPLFLLSTIVIYVFVERTLIISKAQKLNKNLFTNIKDSIFQGDVERALRYCQDDNTLISRLLAVGIKNIGQPIDNIKATFEDFAQLELYYLERKLSTLALITSIAPMIGFLGTVVGMVNMFYGIAQAGGNIDIEVLSNGMYEALITTVAGLVGGIMSSYFYNILVSRINRVIYLMQSHCVNFIEILKQPIE